MNTTAKTPASLFWLGRIHFSLLAVLLLCSSSVGQQIEIDRDQTSPTGKALRTTPWFDAEQRSLKPVDVVPQTDDSVHRDSRWLPKPDRVKAPSRQSSQASPTTTNGPTGSVQSGLFNTGFTALNLLGWLTLAVIVLAGVSAIFYVLSRTESKSAKMGKSRSRVVHRNTPDEQTLERMKHLPEELRRTDVNLRSEAERLMKASEYDQAIILLFAHQLLLLDRYGTLRLNRGKTNRKYVRETRATNNDAAKCLENTVASFERSYFGRHTITRTEFSDTWRLNEQLEAGLEQNQGEAA